MKPRIRITFSGDGNYLLEYLVHHLNSQGWIKDIIKGGYRCNIDGSLDQSWNRLGRSHFN